MALESVHEGARLRLPELDGAIFATGGEVFVVAGEREAEDLAGVAFAACRIVGELLADHVESSTGLSVP